MKKLLSKVSEFLVERRYFVLGIMMILTVAGVLLMSRVNINTDMTSYLPQDSSMKQGLDQMKQDFPNLSLTSSGTVRVMTTGMEPERLQELVGKLRNADEVSLVKYQADSEDYNKGENSLIELTVLYDSESDEFKSLKAQLDVLSKEYGFVYQTGEDALGDIPVTVLLMAVLLLFGILFLMCRSWTEPFLFLVTIGCAIAINNGTNALLPSVSNITHSIAAILQLVLSMDYSIILINRYREERKTLKGQNSSDDRNTLKGQNSSDERKALKGQNSSDDRNTLKGQNSPDNHHTLENLKNAMKAAIAGAFPSIVSSSMTTVVGLLALVFMSFTIGADIGIVLAKGVLISMICILTILPALILQFDGLIEKTEKKIMPLPTKWLSSWAYKGRHVMGWVLVGLFILTFCFKDQAGISYTLLNPSDIDDVFGKDNAVVLLYANEDEDKIQDLLAEFESDPHIKAVNCYATTLGKAMNSDELLAYIAGMGYEEELSQFESLIPLIFGNSGEARFTIEELFGRVQEMTTNPLVSALLSEEVQEKIASAAETIENGKKQLVGETHSILMFDTSYPQESAETNAFLEKVSAFTEEHFSKPVYQIGNSPMQYETSKTFKGELNKISLITAAAIFLVVLLTFHTLSVPLILIVLIQTAVYLTMLFMGMIGAGVYYLALLIVQSILMGATIDYGILYVSLYQEARKRLPVKAALSESFEKAIHTIMTSGMIIVFITWIVGYAFSNPAITQICHIITIGSIMALMLILFVLPGAVVNLTEWKKKE